MNMSTEGQVSKHSNNSDCHTAESSGTVDTADSNYLHHMFDIEEFDLHRVKTEVKESQFNPKDGEYSTTEYLQNTSTKSLVIQSTPRLVECPLCRWECKNNPDRLLRLLDHIQEYHQTTDMETIIMFIFEQYHSLVSFMMMRCMKEISSL